MATLADSFLKDLEDLDLEEEEEEKEEQIFGQNSFKKFKPNERETEKENVKRKEKRKGKGKTKSKGKTKGKGSEKDKVSARNKLKTEEDSAGDNDNNSDYEEIVDAVEEFLNNEKTKTNHKISELLYNEEFTKTMDIIKSYVDKLDESREEEEEKQVEKEEDQKKENENKQKETGNETYMNKTQSTRAGSVEENNTAEKLKLLEESDASELIETCIDLILKIDSEILNIHKYVKDVYTTKFPELDSIVCSPLEYICVVMKIKNETDLTSIDFTDILPNTTIMAVTVASSMTAGVRLPDALLNNCLSVCEEGLKLNEFRKCILIYLESKMYLLAPNLTMLLGSALTARLISFVGSLKSVAFMSAQNLIVVGSSKKSSLGMGNANKTYGIGILSLSEIVQNVGNAYKNKAVKLLAGKCSLAARVDYFKKYREGQYGMMLRENVIQHLIKLQEPLPLKQKKVLPIPDEKLKRKRGGKRYKKLKERTQITELRKQMSRLPFGPNSTDDYYTVPTDEVSSLLNTNITKLKYQTKKITIPAKKSMPLQSSGATGGISSSLIFTPLQGIELYNPSASLGAQKNKKNREDEEKTHNEYFSLNAEFRKL